MVLIIEQIDRINKVVDGDDEKQSNIQNELNRLDYHLKKLETKGSLNPFIIFLQVSMQNGVSEKLDSLVELKKLLIWTSSVNELFNNTQVLSYILNLNLSLNDLIKLIIMVNLNPIKSINELKAIALSEFQNIEEFKKYESHFYRAVKLIDFYDQSAQYFFQQF